MGLKGHRQGGAHAVGPDPGPLRGHCQGGAHAVGPLRGSRRVPIGRWVSIIYRMWNNLRAESRRAATRRVFMVVGREFRSGEPQPRTDGGAWHSREPVCSACATNVLRYPRRVGHSVSRCAQTGHVLPEWLRMATYGYAKMVVPPPARDLYLPAQNLSHCPRLFRALSLICLLACFNGQMSTFENLLSTIYRTVQYSTDVLL